MSWVTILRGKTVIYGDNDGLKFTSETSANGVVCEGSWGEIGEATAVEENDDGKRRRVDGVSVSGGEDSEPEVSIGVEGEVGGFNGVSGSGVGGDLAVEEVHETAVEGAVGAADGVSDGGEEVEREAGFPWEERLRLRRRRHERERERESVRIFGEK